MSKDILIGGGSDEIKPERGDCTPEQWGVNGHIGRPIVFELDL